LSVPAPGSREPVCAALVLAGSRPGAPDPVAAAEGVAHKALVEVGGEPMLTRVVAALRGAGVETIAVSAEEAEVVALAAMLGCSVLTPGRGPSASVARGLSTLGTPMLVTTADHALLRPEWVRDFVADTPEDADVAVLLAHRDRVDAAVPGNRRTYLNLADGGWSGCNLFLLARPRAEAAIATWSAVEADRKRPWRIAARLGLSTLWRYAWGRLTMAEAVARLGRRIGIEARAVPARDGLAAVDVDKPADLAQVRAILSADAPLTSSASAPGST
jgi:GTP:adenosylcobinamide-phosphate guanylyltransferase